MKNKKEHTALTKLSEQEALDSNVLNELSKRILGGVVKVPDRDGNFVDDTSAIDYAENLKKYEESGAPKTQELTIVDPVTKKSNTFLLEHGGTSAQKLAMVLADPNASKEQKDAMTSLYLFEGGKESASFMLDLMGYKGQHIKESKQFQSRIQRDWQFFVELFTNIIMDQAVSMLAVVAPGADSLQLQQDALEYLKKHEQEYADNKKKWESAHRKDKQPFLEKYPTLHDWAEKYYENTTQALQKNDDKMSILMLELGVRYAAEAHNIKTQMHNMIEQREADAGKPHPNFL